MPDPSPPVLGIDIGGSGIKGAPVDLASGGLVGERVRIETPQPSRPEDVAAVVAEIARGFQPTTGAGPIGITLPAVVKHGVAHTAANIDPSWIGTDAAALFRDATGRPCVVLNDAQAAVIAEARFGAARGRDGVVLLLTFGTGIGSGLLVDGHPVEGVELGHLRIGGEDAEHLAAASVRDEEDLSWKEWTKRINVYLENLEHILWCDLILVGGGVSEKADKWVPRLRSRAELAVAELRNDAGIVGAAVSAAGPHAA